MINRIIYKISGLLMLLCVMLPVEAQNAKDIRISQDRSFTDHIALKQDSRDMDLIAKFVFNEMENTLSVSLMSYRNLFVFQDDMRYKQVIRRSKIRPDRFPYVVEYDAEAKYKVTKEFKELIPGSKKKHVFRRWIAYEGLQPQPTDYKMLNDYIEQKFDILNKDTLVTVSLKDVLVMEASPDKKKRFDFLYFTDLNREYKVHIVRNPCLGLDEDIATLQATADNIRTSYETLKERYVAQETNEPEALALLAEMQGMLSEQFPPKKQESGCPDMRRYTEAYNCYVDSIQRLASFKFAFEGKIDALPTDAEHILGVARIIDNNVASWLVSLDVVEKEDLKARSQKLIDEMHEMIDGEWEVTEEQAIAISVFRKAENYFKKTCVQKKKKK